MMVMIIVHTSNAGLNLIVFFLSLIYLQKEIERNLKEHDFDYMYKTPKIGCVKLINFSFTNAHCGEWFATSSNLLARFVEFRFVTLTSQI